MVSSETLARKPFANNVTRLGLNRGSYRGQTIDIKAVLRECMAAGRRHGWECEELPVSSEVRLLTLHRPAKTPYQRVYLSSGIHGDEPATPLAALQLLQDDPWPDGLELWMCPCLNPTGFPRNLRENARGIDLNRDYRHSHSEEVRAHTNWLERQPAFDIAFCLHEDWEAHGFYLYELNPDHQPSCAEQVIKAVAAVCPIDLSPVIEGRRAQNGIIAPELNPVERLQWPEAFYLITHKTRQSYTLEAPSDFALPLRVAALVTAVKTVMANLGDSGVGQS
jgi:hypothetical protein